MSFSPVYIQAYSCLSPAGFGIQTLMVSLMEGRTHLQSGLGSLPAELDRDLERLRTEKALKDQDRVALMGVLLARSLPRMDEDTGVIVGSSRGAAASIESFIAQHLAGQRLRPSTSPTTTASGISSAISRDLKLSGPSFFLSAACSTGLFAVIQGVASIRSSLAESFLVGGIEAANTPFTRDMMAATKVLSTSLQEYPCRPGASDREGMVLSEGAGLIHLSTKPSSLAIVGIGAATESSTLTGVSENGDALQKAIHKALRSAGLNPGAIDLIVGHGAGTVRGDESEMNAYTAIFSGKIPPLVFHKWCGGHMLGASAALSVMLASEHLKNSETPPHPYFEASHV
ncbi:MAG: hypothetical protein EOP10_28670, partial [Proteobacteria bacterium]